MHDLRWRRRILRSAVAVVAALVVGCGSEASGGSGSEGSDQPLTATDVAVRAGIAEPSQTHGENCLADLDGDGHRDLILSRHKGWWPLYRGRADGTFERDERVTFPHADRHGCAVADFDGDGLLDVYASVGACRGTCQTVKELWIQQPDHSFVNESAAWGVDDPWGRGRVPVILDVNGDDLPDLFVGQDVGVDRPSPSRLWINRGDRFEEQPGPQSRETGNHCADAVDLDGDGLDELAICTSEAGFRMFRNVEGTFVDDNASFGLTTEGRRNVEFADVDGDGQADLVEVHRKAVKIRLNRSGVFGEPLFDQTTVDAVDVALGDIDGDDDADLYIVESLKSDGRDLVLLNDGEGEFTPGPELPRRQQGAGDSVLPIPDWNGTGRAAFLVNNGFQDDPGPRQLWAFSGG